MFRNKVKGHTIYQPPYEAEKEDQSEAIELSSHRNELRYHPADFMTNTLDPSRGGSRWHPC